MRHLRGHERICTHDRRRKLRNQQQRHKQQKQVTVLIQIHFTSRENLNVFFKKFQNKLRMRMCSYHLLWLASPKTDGGILDSFQWV